ncbi:hypothetical protein HY643_05345 [Candidatus Woesearchaeota archaeon]|nr:hypothetical protein [Candidatus Woesearchaeota archaeon]
MNDNCKECFRWKLFKDNCYYYWESKAECFSKVLDEKEMAERDALRQKQ